MSDDQQRIGVIGTGHGATGTSEPPPGIAAVARGRFAAELIETRLQIFPDTPDHRADTAIGYLEAGYRAEAEGCSAVFINTVGDYGLKRLRRCLSIPVVGAGQAGMSVAASLADNFAIVTIWPRSLEFIYRDLLKDYGWTQKCIGIRFGSEDAALSTLTEPDNFVERMRRGEADMLENLQAHCDAAAQGGAGAILLGCTCMSPIAHILAEASAVPVVDPMTAGYRYTELLLDAGLMPGPLGAGGVVPDRSQVDALIAELASQPQPEALINQ